MRLLLMCFFIISSYWVQAQSTISILLDSARVYRFSNAEKTAVFARKAYVIAKEANDSIHQAEGAGLLGVAAYMQGNRDEALGWYLEAEKLYELKKDTIGLINTYNDLCVFYVKGKKYTLGTTVADKAIALATAIHNVDKIATAYNNKGLVFLDTKQFDSAVHCFDFSYINYKSVNSYVGMSYSLNYMASAYAESGQPAKALECLKGSIELSVKTGDKYGEASAVNNIGELLLGEKKPKEALVYFKEAQIKCKDINFIDLEDNIYKMMAVCYEQMGDYKSAYAATQKQIETHNKLVNDHQLKAIEEMQTRYETGKKEQQNKLLTEKNLNQAIQLSRNKIIGIALSIIALLAIGVLYLFYTRSKITQAAKFKEELYTHEKLRASAIVDAEENERQRLSRELHDGVGQLLAATRRKIQTIGEDGETVVKPVDESIALLDDAIKEVRQLSHNMMPPWLRNKTLVQAIEELVNQVIHTTGLEVQTEWVDTEHLKLNKIQVLMLYRSVQEMVSNTIRHAQATMLNIEVINHGNELNIMVYDNGKGFNKETVLSSSAGIGIKNIQSRIEYIGGQLQVDSFPGNGTTYTIYLPLNVQA